MKKLLFSLLMLVPMLAVAQRTVSTDASGLLTAPTNFVRALFTNTDGSVTITYLGGGRYNIGATGLVQVTTTCYTSSNINTNILIVSGAGTATANGIYNWSTGQQQFTNGVDAIRFDSGYGAWILTNSVSGVLYDAFNPPTVGVVRPWDDVINGVGPTPTDSYGPITNCFTNSTFTYAASLPVVGTNIYVSQFKGNDTNAVKGSINFKYKSIDAALAACVPGDTLEFEAGDYPFTSTPLQVTNSIHIKGAGRGITRIGTEGGAEEQLILNNDVVVSDLTFHGSLHMGISPGTGITCSNVIIANCDVLGLSDSILANIFNNLRIINCRLISTYDGFADWDSRAGGSNRVARLYNCDILITNGGFSTLHGISGGDSRIEMYGGSIEVHDGSVDNACVYLSVDGFRTNLSGSVLLSNVRLRASVGGTTTQFVTNFNNLSVILDNCTMEIINSVLVSGVYTNQTSDRTIAIPNGAARTNRLVNTLGFTNSFAQVSANGHEVTIYDKTGTASGTNIVIKPFGTQKINGQSSTNITQNYGSMTLLVDGTNWLVKSVTVAGGGGAGATALSQLTDVSISGLAVGQLLQAWPDGLWHNTSVAFNNYYSVTVISNVIFNVGTNSEQSVAVQTPISFGAAYNGTPLPGERFNIAIYNTSITTNIYFTNNSWNTLVASNVQVYLIPSNSIASFTFVNRTNWNTAGTNRWELDRLVQKEMELAAGSGITLTTNTDSSVVTIAATGSGTPGGTEGSIQVNTGSAFWGTNQFWFDITNQTIRIGSGSAFRLSANQLFGGTGDFGFGYGAGVPVSQIKLGASIYATGSRLAPETDDLTDSGTDLKSWRTNFAKVLYARTGIVLRASAGAGKVLTSDADGYGSWSNAPAGGGGPTTNAPPYIAPINLGLGTTNILIDMLALGATNTVRATLTGNVGLMFTNIIDGKDVTLEVIQDSTGNRTLATNATWGFNQRWGIDITGIALSTNAGYYDLLKFHGSGTNAQAVGNLRGFAP